MSETTKKETTLYGIGGSPGICIGKAYLVDREGVDVVPKYAIAASNLENEVKRFKAAVKKATDELRAIINETTETFRDPIQILETHLVLLKDKMLYGRTLQVIESEKINAEWALKKVVSQIKPMFESMADPYLRDRAEDILHVANRIMSNLVGNDATNISAIDKRVILVARDLSPAQTSQIQLERVKGFVTDRGGRASHTSIIARTLEIPAVLGLDNASLLIKNDDIIIVDGTAGVVIINPSEQTLIEAEERKEALDARRAAYARKGHLPAETKDGRRLSVMGNIELPEEVVAVLDKGGDGIGLYRTEFQYLSRSSFPSEDELFDSYKGVIDILPDKPVTIRTLDINGDKAMMYNNGQDEANPALGLRAIRYCLQKPSVFKTQLRAILRAARHGWVRLLIPMISNIEEVLETKRVINDVIHELKKEKVPFQQDVPLGVMIEVPSAALIADTLIHHVDFFSIGTNDLIQYTMAIDRGNRHVAYLYNPLHPSVLRLIKMVCDAAQRHNKPVYMCGEMASEPIYVPILLALGLNEFSTHPQAVPMIKDAVRLIDIEQAKQVLAELLEMDTAEAIEKRLYDIYGNLLNNHNQRTWRR